MERSHCLDCGELSLSTDSVCWACGGRRLAGPGSGVVGEATIQWAGRRAAGLAASARAISLPDDWKVPALAGTAVLLFIACGMLGFQLGRGGETVRGASLVPAAAAPSAVTPGMQPSPVRLMPASAPLTGAGTALGFTDRSALSPSYESPAEPVRMAYAQEAMIAPPVLIYQARAREIPRVVAAWPSDSVVKVSMTWGRRR